MWGIELRCPRVFIAFGASASRVSRGSAARSNRSRVRATRTESEANRPCQCALPSSGGHSVVHTQRLAFPGDGAGSARSGDCAPHWTANGHREVRQVAALGESR